MSTSKAWENAVCATPLSQQEMIASGLFDAAFYLARYPDVARSGIEPLEHFLSHHGLDEGREPSLLFCPSEYLELNPDLADWGEPLIYHFMRFGRDEGRLGSRIAHVLMLSGMFDPDYYVSSNPDVQADGVDPLFHYLHNGWRELRRPSQEFDLNAYWAAFPDVAPGTVEPVSHYLYSLSSFRAQVP